LKVGEFLTHSRQQLVTCLPDDPLHTVARRMFTHEIGAMPVCELGNTQMVGIISERDLVRALPTGLKCSTYGFATLWQHES
jgi:CBS domain-containing protein